MNRHTKKYTDDFEYVYHALQSHPSFQRGNSRYEFERIYSRLQPNVVDYDILVNALTELTVFFQDGHTNIEMPYASDDECLKINCEWCGDKLLLKKSYDDVEAGAEIVAVEGQKSEELLQWAASRIPHENLFLVKSRMVEYPYMNYHIFSKMNLVQLFGEKDCYEITFCVNGTEVRRCCELTRYDGFVDFSQGDFVTYEIKEDTAVLHLNECICNEQYKHILHELAVLCYEKNINTMELDLSRNMGGSSAVIDEFLQYVDVDSFKRYEMIDYSSGEADTISCRKQIVLNQKKNVLFPKNIICRVSYTTFSSARTFAVTLKDNGIATIVGEPTGGKPCSYGMPRRDVTPNCHIRFRVSRALFLRPDEDLEEQISLFPDGVGQEE